jgi:hypothetical protein
MRKIEGSIFSHLDLTNKVRKSKVDIAAAEPMIIETFDELVRKIAHLSFENRDHLLFYRGQRREHLNRDGNSSLYPSIYRTKNGENLSADMVRQRFKILDQASALLVKKFSELGLANSFKELKKRKYIQWSILQHYEVCDTPLLDLTQSIRVACSFALSKGSEHGIFYVLGLPYFTNRISINSEYDIVNVRLINICPPQAMRPYFQEGYLVGTDDASIDYEDRTEFDFKRRLIAKFKIPNTKGFWGGQNSLENYLMPVDDEIENICKQIHFELQEENNIQLMFPGTWRNEYHFRDGRVGVELIQIRNGNEYFINQKGQYNHVFNLDSVTIDKEKGEIKFRKVGIDTDNRKAFNDLKIINLERYEGIETNGTQLVYTKWE